MNGSLNRESVGWGILPIRLAIGLVFAMHGGQKLFVYGATGTTMAMLHMGIPLPAVAAWVAILVEFIGGLAVFFGVWARWPAFLLSIEMLIVILFVKLHSGFFSPRGIELELMLLAGALTIALLGTGPASLAPGDRVRSPEP
ncbi:MAG TPA: DoxX family protein [Gemmatimonadaceae bacterium]|nr:DoxX family protein [Gemmatimonadaceae bacterium]